MRLRRHLLGILALVLMGAGLFLWTQSPDETLRAIGSMSWRIGLTLAVLWLALPQVVVLAANVPPRTLAVIVMGGLIVAVRPRMFPIVILILAALGVMEGIAWLFRPLPKQRGRR
jgi:hypothetical protein